MTDYYMCGDLTHQKYAFLPRADMLDSHPSATPTTSGTKLPKLDVTSLSDPLNSYLCGCTYRICLNLTRHFCLQRITEKQNMVVITDRMWARLLSSTNQPSFLRPKDLEEVKNEEHQQTQLLDGDNNVHENSGH